VTGTSPQQRPAAAIQRRALRDFLRWLGGASPGATTFEAPGVTAAIVPVTPERSIVNSVSFDDDAALEAAYDDLAAAYERHGVAAWTVWTPDFEEGAIALLTGKGHEFDGKPAAMTLDLAGFEPPDLGDLDWDSEASFAELGRLNDAAYGHAGRDDGYAPAMAGAGGERRLRLYRARSEGEVASVLATIDHDDGDLGIYFVATPDEHQGKGLATRLLAAALIEGQDRGLRTSSLQSSAKGEPVYTRLGYRRHFRLHLYERRR
jgi:predicted GNAT family acetyltransferase